MTSQELQENVGQVNEVVKSKLSPQAKVTALGSLHSSLQAMQLAFASSGQENMALAANLGAQLSSICSTLETMSALSKSGSSLLKFSSTLSLVSVGLTLLTTFMEESKEEGLVAAFTALADMIREGFQTVLDTLHRLSIHLDVRFDRLERMLDRRTYTLELGILEMLHQGKRLDVILDDLCLKTRRSMDDMRLRMDDLGHSLSLSFDLVRSSMSAFRHEGLYKLLAEIHYMDKTDLLSEDKIHTYLSTLHGTWIAVGKSPHVNGMALISGHHDEILEALKSSPPEDLIGYLTGKAVGHPTILRVIHEYMVVLMSKLDGPPLPFHADLFKELEKEQSEIDQALQHPQRDHLPSLTGLVNDEKKATLMRDLGYAAHRSQDNERDTAIAHLRTLFDHSLFDVYREEMVKMTKGHPGQVDGGSQNPCSVGQPLAYRCFVEKHHKVLGPCKKMPQSRWRWMYTGVFCGWSANNMYGHRCYRDHAYTYRLGEPICEGGSAEAITSFLAAKHPPTFHEQVMKLRLERWLAAISPTSSYLMVHITIQSKVFMMPHVFTHPLVDRLMTNGFRPVLHLTLDLVDKMTRGYVSIEDVDPPHPSSRIAWTSNLQDNLPLAMGDISSFTPTDVLLTCFFGGWTSERFGFHWHKTDSVALSGSHTNSTHKTMYTLGINDFPPTFGLACDTLVRETLTEEVVEPLTSSRNSAIDTLLEKSCEGKALQTKTEILRLVDEKLHTLRSTE